jgi:hypothetical protein
LPSFGDDNIISTEMGDGQETGEREMSHSPREEESLKKGHGNASTAPKEALVLLLFHNLESRERV